MKSYIRLLILLLTAIPFLFIKGKVAAQNPQFLHYGVEKGLSQESAICVIQDSEGFIWIGTYDGLNRFDGYNFKVFRHEPDDSLSLSYNYVKSLMERSDGKLWVGTYGGGISVFDKKTERFERLKADANSIGALSNGRVLCMMEDSRQNIWVGTDQAINLLKKGQKGFEKFLADGSLKNGFIPNRVSGFMEDKKGNIWAASHGGGLILRRAGQEVFENFKSSPEDSASLSHNDVLTVTQLRDNQIWAGGRNGLINVYQPKTNSFQRIDTKQDGRMFVFKQVSNEHIWAGTDNGILLIDLPSKGSLFFTNKGNDPYSISGRVTRAIVEDQNRNLWIGNDGGLHFLDPRTLDFGRNIPEMQTSDGLSNSSVMALMEDSKGRVFIGSYGNGISIFDPAKGSYVFFTKESGKKGFELPDNRVHAFLEDSHNNIWVGTDKGLVLYDEAKAGFIAEKTDPEKEPAIRNNYARTLFEDRQGNVWVGTRGGGMYKMTSPWIFEGYQHDKKNKYSLSDNVVRCFFQTKKHGMWIGTDQGVSILRNPDEKFIDRLQHDEKNTSSLSSDVVWSILEDSKGRIWVSTSGGLNLYLPDSKGFKHYRSKNGLSNDVVYSVLEDNRGMLWLSTNNGINRFNPEKETFKHYDEKDGLQSREFNTGSYHKGKSGKLYFGGLRGYNAFYPDSIKENYYTAKPVLTDLLVFNQKAFIKPDLAPERSQSIAYFTENGKTQYAIQKHIQYTDEIMFDYADDIFGFEFAMLNFRQADKNSYAYKLEGFDADWVLTDAQNRRAVYTNIPHGDYVFKLKAANDDGHWGEEIKTIKVKILPPWYLTVWFKVFAFISLAGLAVFVVKFREHSLQAQKKALEQLVNLRTEELSMQNEEIMAQRDLLEENNHLILKEKEKSEKLLLNILPYDTAKELKEKGYAATKSYGMATVMFTDFKGFTTIAADMVPEDLVAELDYCFRAFDGIIKKHGLEKIKTIGDAYMCAGGIPVPNTSNAADAVAAAMEIMEFMKEWKAQKEAKGEKAWEIRAGIHTGKLVAGVVGQDKFVYDIWGDTVNLASRMESMGEAWKINISEATYLSIKDAYKCTYRGEIEAKNKGKVNMYFVEGRV